MGSVLFLKLPERKRFRSTFLFLLPLLLYIGLNLFFAESLDLSFSEAVFYLLAAFCEELLFRAAFLAWELKRSFSIFSAVLLNALLFGALHLANLGTLGVTLTLLQAVNAFSLGLLLAAATIRAESVLPALFLHGLINISGTLPVRASGISYYVSWLLAAAIVTASGFALLRREKENEILH